MVETWLHALDIKSCWRVIATVAERRLCKQHKRAATYPNTNTDTGRYEKNRPRTHAKRLNRDSVVLGVSLRTQRAAEGETRFKSDSPNWSRDLRSYVKFNVTTGEGGRSLSMTGLGASSLEA